MNLNQWAIKWGIPFEAIEDLRREFGTINTDPEPGQDLKPEAVVQNIVRTEASSKGLRLWRNNTGVAIDENGDRTIRYGLFNDSKKINKVIKSPDLVGIRPRFIMPADVGTVIGQFVGRACKRAGWQYTATERERAQLKGLELIASLGWDATFANSAGTL